MTIIIKKDGQIITDDGNPIEGKALENAAVILADPQDGDAMEYNSSSGQWVNKKPYLNQTSDTLFPNGVMATAPDFAELWDGEHTFKLQLTIIKAGTHYGAKMEWVADEVIEQSET